MLGIIGVSVTFEHICFYIRDSMPKMLKPLVSIITPVYNSGEFVGEAIRSVQMQSFSDWEMILVDDGSTDDSVEIVESFVNVDHRIRYIQLASNSGAAVARNVAIKAAQGRFIAFLDSDDRWLPHKLERQLAFMQMNDYSFGFTAYDKINESGKIFEHVGAPHKVTYFDLLKTCSIGCLTAIYDSEYFGKVDMPIIRKGQDFGLWLQLLKKTDYAFGLNETLAQYRVRKDSVSSNKLISAQFTWRLYREFEGLSLMKASYYFMHYAFRGILRARAPIVARFLRIL